MWWWVVSRAERAGLGDGRDRQGSARDSFEVCGGVTTDKPRSQDAQSAALEGRPQVGSERKSRTLYQLGTWAVPKQQLWGLT